MWIRGTSISYHKSRCGVRERFRRHHKSHRSDIKRYGTAERTFKKMKLIYSSIGSMVPDYLDEYTVSGGNNAVPMLIMLLIGYCKTSVNNFPWAFEMLAQWFWQLILNFMIKKTISCGTTIFYVESIPGPQFFTIAGFLQESHWILKFQKMDGVRQLVT